MGKGRLILANCLTVQFRISDEVVTERDLAYAQSEVGEFGGDNRAVRRTTGCIGGFPRRCPYPHPFTLPPVLQGIDRTLHRISCIRNRRGKVVGLTCRVGRAVRGSAAMVQDLLKAGLTRMPESAHSLKSRGGVGRGVRPGSTATVVTR